MEESIVPKRTLLKLGGMLCPVIIWQWIAADDISCDKAGTEPLAQGMAQFNHCLQTIKNYANYMIKNTKGLFFM